MIKYNDDHLILDKTGQHFPQEALKIITHAAFQELKTPIGQFVQNSSTKTGANGTYLGFVISKQVVKIHNRTIQFKNSQKGRSLSPSACTLFRRRGDV